MLNNEKKATIIINGKEITIKTGAIAKQANGSITLHCGDTVLLATATMAKREKEDIDFFPLTIEYSEKMYAAGKIPGGFFKREARPRVGATLTARLIDRPLRPSFPAGFRTEVQVVVTVLSYDDSFPPEFLGIIASSAALSVSDIPFNGPIGAALVAQVDNEFVFNPTYEQVENSALEIIVAGTKDAILMVEAGANEVSEETVIKAIQFAHEKIKETIKVQEDLVSAAGKTKKIMPEAKDLSSLETSVNQALGSKIEDNMKSGNKQEIEDFLTALEAEIIESHLNEEGDNEKDIKAVFGKLKKDRIRKTIITQKIRPDGRRLDEIRPIETEIDLLPTAHGSALFTRGETQSLGVVTLGTSVDEQIEDGLPETHRKPYFFHYNFPPYSVGEVGRLGFTSRRELGHGALAEKALKPVLPEYDDFPYTIRIVSEILESNGSSSMASVCSGSLALMDCGAPIKGAVSGIAMGLLIDGDDYSILSDIQGLEDHYGDMDFKVAGTEKGITALQLDIKVSGLSEKILTEALFQAKTGRHHILGEMLKTIEKPRDSITPNAPKIENLTVNPEKVGAIIGPGGKMIRKIEEESKAQVTVSDGTTGQVSISAKNTEDLETAKAMIMALVKDVEKGEKYEGKVVRTTNFGAFVEILPGKEGLLHISKISEQRIAKVEDVLNVGDKIAVKVEEIDRQNRISLIRDI